MAPEESHLSHQDLLLAVDGELPPREAARVESHLASCWDCRVRKQEIETTIAEFIRLQRRSFSGQIAPSDGPRALLRAQLAQLSEAEDRSALEWLRAFPWRIRWVALAGLAIVGISALVVRNWSERQAARMVAVTVPNPSLTPGATVLLSQGQVCRETSAKNKTVPVALRRRVFD